MLRCGIDEFGWARQHRCPLVDLEPWPSSRKRGEGSLTRIGGEALRGRCQHHAMSIEDESYLRESSESRHLAAPLLVAGIRERFAEPQVRTESDGEVDFTHTSSRISDRDLWHHLTRRVRLAEALEDGER